MNFSRLGFKNKSRFDGKFNKNVANKLNFDRDSIVSFSFSFRAIEIEHQKLATLSFLSFNL
jgi:hypothetical protein